MNRSKWNIRIFSENEKKNCTTHTQFDLLEIMPFVMRIVIAISEEETTDKQNKKISNNLLNNNKMDTRDYKDITITRSSVLCYCHCICFQSVRCGYCLAIWIRGYSAEVCVCALLQPKYLGLLQTNVVNL